MLFSDRLLAPTGTTIGLSDTLFTTGTHRFDIGVGLNSSGDTIVTLPTSGDINAPGNAVEYFGSSYTLTGSGSSYNDFQLVILPGLQSANLFVNGVEVLKNYTGESRGYSENPGIMFNALSGGTANFASVQLSTITSAVPEAGEWAMMLLGLPLLGLPLLGWVVRRKQAAMQIVTA